MCCKVAAQDIRQLTDLDCTHSKACAERRTASASGNDHPQGMGPDRGGVQGSPAAARATQMLEILPAWAARTTPHHRGRRGWVSVEIVARRQPGQAGKRAGLGGHFRAIDRIPMVERDKYIGLLGSAPHAVQVGGRACARQGRVREHAGWRGHGRTTDQAECPARGRVFRLIGTRAKEFAGRGLAGTTRGAWTNWAGERGGSARKPAQGSMQRGKCVEWAEPARG